MRRCNELLTLTSRSFAAVIQALDDALRYNVYMYIYQRYFMTIIFRFIAQWFTIKGEAMVLYCNRLEYSLWGGVHELLSFVSEFIQSPTSFTLPICT